MGSVNRAIALVVLALLPRPAHADEATAQIAYRQAEDLAKADKWAEACPLYEASYKADPQIGVLLHLAECHEKVGQNASAWSEYNDAVELAHRKGDQREGLAQSRIDAIAPKLAKLRVAKMTPSPPGLVVKRDGVDMTVLVGTDMPIDPGEHEIVATAPGFTDRHEHVKIDPQPTVTRLDLVLEPAKAAEPAVAATPSPAAAGVTAQATPPGRSPLVGWIAEVGLGVSTTPDAVAPNQHPAAGHQVTLRAGIGRRFGSGPVTVVAQLEYAHKGGSYDFDSGIPGNIGGRGVGYNLNYIEVPATVRYRAGVFEVGAGGFVGFGVAASYGSAGQGMMPMVQNFKPFNVGVQARAALVLGPLAVTAFADTSPITTSDDIKGGISTLLVLVGYEVR
jgi:hypothetical protein